MMQDRDTLGKSVLGKLGIFQISERNCFEKPV